MEQDEVMNSLGLDMLHFDLIHNLLQIKRSISSLCPNRITYS